LESRIYYNDDQYIMKRRKIAGMNCDIHIVNAGILVLGEGG